MKKWLAMAAAIGSLTACSGDGGGPTSHWRLPDVFGSELQCSQSSTAAGQAMLAADRKRHRHAAMPAVKTRR